ncbi:hypothetical protein SeMB42_g05516 [Synchytrium endobioticum]|uniref:Cation/H+ exchanger transmembrane domain-containing protein n=1 Tax=Synchytrium endobioticum TaxID=286115 RepID=A0A507CVW4_9FUNG|nr:hypothetical protein SeMB42_g05516 [Synchytrium endobioticum]TPX43181.1 hypothetical protein SeLEV6574_g05199 [Synchytrium endobioticum]
MAWPNLDVAVNSVPAICAMLGGFVLFFGFGSLIIKERIYLSESLVAVIVGIIFGPLAINLLDLSTLGIDVAHVTFQFAQIVIAIQVLNAAIVVPSTFWKSHVFTLFILYVPVMLVMWLATALMIWLIFGLDVWECLSIAACLTPTDPVLANSIINGKFADTHVPVLIRWLLSAESGGNDGAGVPLFELGLQFLRHKNAGVALKYWILQTILYEMCGGILLGALVGYLANVLLKISEVKGWIDKKSFLAFEIALALFTIGLGTILEVASFLMVFTTGLVFAWDGRFVEETAEAHVQEVIDMLVNLTFFVYYGTAIPWELFNTAETPLPKLFGLAIAILAFRRMPIIALLHRWLPPLMTMQEIVFYGWFGPIGVGALWYVAEFHAEFPEKKYAVGIVNFMVLASVLVHGVTLPLFQMTVITLSTISARRDIRAPAWPSNVPLTAEAISGPISGAELPRPPDDEKNAMMNGKANGTFAPRTTVGSADTVHDPAGSAPPDFVPIDVQDDLGGVPLTKSGTGNSVTFADETTFGIPLASVGRSTSGNGAGILKNMNWIGPMAGDDEDTTFKPRSEDDPSTIVASSTTADNGRSSYEYSSNSTGMPPGGVGIPLSSTGIGNTGGGFANVFGRKTRLSGWGTDYASGSGRSSSPSRRRGYESDEDRVEMGDNGDVAGNGNGNRTLNN